MIIYVIALYAMPDCISNYIYIYIYIYTHTHKSISLCVCWAKKTTNFITNNVSDGLQPAQYIYLGNSSGGTQPIKKVKSFHLNIYISQMIKC